MYNQRVVAAEPLPLPLAQRRPTDVLCTCLHSLFLLALLAAAILSPAAGLNAQPQPTCTHPQLKLWISTAPQPVLCVAECPPEYQPIGQACFPLPPSALDEYLRQSPLGEEWRQAHLRPIIIFTIILAASLAVVLLGLSYFAPRIFQRVVIILALIILVYASLVLLGLLQCPYPLGEALGGIDMRKRQACAAGGTLLAITLLGWVVCLNGELSWNGVMMDYAAKILPQRISFLCFILQYYAGVALAFALFALQHHSFSHSSSLFLSWTISPSCLSVLRILNIVEYFWNLQFMKDSLYLSLATLTTSFYFSQEADCCSVVGVNCVHTGSKAGGALIGTLFYLPHCLLEGLCCFPQQPEREDCGLCCTSLTGVARQDAYAYQSISAIPYCNASRECRKLSNQSHFWTGTSSPLSSSRFLTHCLGNSLCLGVGCLLMLIQHVQVTLWSVLMLLIICEGVISGLIDVLPIVAQSLQTSLLVDDAISTPKQHIYDRLKTLDGDLREYLHSRKAVSPFSH